MNKKKHSPRSADVVVTGAGLAGLHMLHRLWAQVQEASHGVGGIWCRTDDYPNFDLATAHATAMPAVTS